MVTGSLARAGYTMGDALYKPRAANPKGFFEDPEINGINEALLATVVPASAGLGENQRWLAALPADVTVRASTDVEARIRRATRRAPFCYKDPRFSHTLPAWRPHLGDVGLVCVFRHPLTTVRSVLKEVHTAAYLQGVPFDEARAFALWASTYRAILHRHAQSGDWLFVHYDQMLQPEGVARLGRFLRVEADASFPDALLHRPPPEDGQVPAEVSALYAELCERAGHRAAPSIRRPSNGPDVTVLVVREPGDPVDGLPALLADQRQVSAELLVVDTTPTPVQLPGATVLHVPTWSRGEALRAGVVAARGRHVATWLPGVTPLPAMLAHGVAALDAAPGAAVAVCDGWVSRPPEQFVRRLEAGGAGFASSVWPAGAVWRREALAEVGVEAFHPVERARLEELRAQKRVVRVEEPGFHVGEALAARLEAAGTQERLLLGPPSRGVAPEISVILCTFNRCEVLRASLAAFCAQSLPRGTFEIVLVDDGSTDGTESALAGLQFGLPVTRLRRENGGLAAARNTGIAAARGRLLHFVNDDTLPLPDCLGEHLAAHAAHPGRDIVVLGTFEQPSAALDNALMRVCETGTLVFCYSLLTPGSFAPSRFFYTCNLTVAADRVRAVGGFDADFRHYGAEDTDLGLRLGLPVLYHTAARARHLHTWGYPYLAHRNPMVARAHVRLFRKHPDEVDSFGMHEASVASLDATLSARAPVEAELDRAAAGLSAVDVGALERLGEGWKPYVAETTRRLTTLLNERNRGWWMRGLRDGLVEHGFDSFAALLAEHPLRFDVPGEAVLVFPASDGDWRGVVKRFVAARMPDRTLVLVVTPGQVDLLKGVMEGVPGVRVEGFARPAGHQVRLLAGAAAWVPTGSQHDERVRRLAALTAVREEDPARWTREEAPWPLVSAGHFRLLAWPRWDDEQALTDLLDDLGRALAEVGDATLVLRFDPERDGSPDAAIARLQAAGERVPDVDLEVVLVGEPMGEREMGRLLRAVDAVAGPSPLVHPRVVATGAELRAAMGARAAG